jgi:hypothetical protein
MKPLLVFTLLCLSACTAKPTSYYCLTPMGWMSFDNQSSKVIHSYRGTTVRSEESDVTFTACVSEMKK